MLVFDLPHSHAKNAHVSPFSNKSFLKVLSATVISCQKFIYRYINKARESVRSRKMMQLNINNNSFHNNQKVWKDQNIHQTINGIKKQYTWHSQLFTHTMKSLSYLTF